ncbi:hypothetical protein D877_gp19 [Edwardsiella phage KF-1]|uniref:Uncharacterized protein n=1 Tax=Edwardsiella phage KF-1 TaxID=1244856 RepID=K4PXC7_9CAUD|nr:hypothetical protein D877_gp19 [Edwardsiella phage KF-1]BAM63067.1 hypothetical protein [Edwardsiella phage KF-1]
MPSNTNFTPTGSVELNRTINLAKLYAQASINYINGAWYEVTWKA